MSDTAVCRGCRRVLSGKPYHMGGDAYVPGPKLERAKVNFYGGYVCSPDCDRRASLELERTMPGHSWDQARLSGPAATHFERNWRDA
jgi:hypothetical protein